MDINEIGATAFIVAGIRALEDTREHPMFSDPYARLFLNEELRARALQLAQVHFAVGDAIRLRTVAFNVIVETEIGRGVRQIVTLGAGLDMRQAIFATEGVRFFDVDQPAVLEFKASVLAKAGIPACPSVPCNYLEVNLPELLADAGLDPEAETLIVWEGNTMYLPGELIFGFLDQLCERMPRFRIAFDHFPQSVLDGSYPDAEAIDVVRNVEKVMNVDFLTGFDSLDTFERRTPFRIIESGNILQAGLRLAGPDAQANIGQTADVSEDFAGVYRIALLERK